VLLAEGGGPVVCGGVSVRVADVVDVKGLCSIAFIQKRKRFLFELECTINWQAETVRACLRLSGARSRKRVSQTHTHSVSRGS
jgi:hypothetical protein